MITYIFYTPNNPMEREVNNLVQRLERLQVATKLVDPDRPDGAALAELYDISSRPAAVLARDDGTEVERWTEALPIPEDVSYLAHQ